MRQAALLALLAAALTVESEALAAGCSEPPCVDAEPLWLTPAGTRFAAVSDTGVPPAGGLSGAVSFTFRLRPAVLTVPAPNRDGRDVNLLRYATDASLALRVGIGNGLELTAIVPAGLYQRGAGIKGITDQSAPALPAQGLHDPRVGFGYRLDTGSPRYEAKLRFEAKLPLGDADELAGEASPVASPSLALSSAFGRLAAGAEVGLRLRRPVDFYGSRIGSQALFAIALGYELPRPALTFTLEHYLLPSLLGASSSRYLAAEWLVTAQLGPRAWSGLSFGLGAGGGLPFGDSATGHTLSVGVPAFRGLLFARFAPR